MHRLSIRSVGVVTLLAALTVFAFDSPMVLAWPSRSTDVSGPQGDPTVPPSVAGLLSRIKETDRGQLAVSEEDGRLLRVLAAGSRAQRALEIGAASGYSAIWIGLGLRETGGRLVTIEFDPARAREAQANVQRAGLGDIVTVVAGDAFKEIPRLAGTFDFVFLDAWKKDYMRFLDLVLPRLDRGGLFLAHNVVNKRDEMSDFLAAISGGSDLLTAVVTPSGEGISVSYRRR
jgi:caffeoyl-CoA O-methyltransferase